MANLSISDSRFPDNPNSEDFFKLDREIATRRGWSDFYTRAEWFEDPFIGSYQQGVQYGTEPGCYPGSVVSQYSTNASAFFLLIGDMYIDSGRQAVGNHLYWFTVSDRRYTAYHAQRLVAGCLAWLKWFDDNHTFNGTEYLPKLYTYPADPGGRFPTLYVNTDGWEVYLEETHSKPYVVSTPSGDPLTGHATLEEAKRQADYYAADAQARRDNTEVQS